MNLDQGRILPGLLLVKPIQEDERTQSGLLIKPVDIVKKRTYVGEVVLVGEELPSLNHKIAVGDKVLHPASAFITVEIGFEEYRLLKAADVLFIYK